MARPGPGPGGRRLSQLWPRAGLCWERGDAGSGASLGRHRAQQPRMMFPRGSFAVSGSSCPGLELLMLIALAVQAESQSEKREGKPRPARSRGARAGQGAVAQQGCASVPSRIQVGLVWRQPRPASPPAGCASPAAWFGVAWVMFPALSGKLMLAWASGVGCLGTRAACGCLVVLGVLNGQGYARGLFTRSV